MVQAERMRIMIVEDEFLVAMHLEELLAELGHVVVASMGQLCEAVDCAHTMDLDLAILDINLGGAQSFPVAQVLRSRGIPFVFATGYGRDGVSEEFRGELTLQKPYEAQELSVVVRQVAARVSAPRRSFHRAPSAR